MSPVRAVVLGSTRPERWRDYPLWVWGYDLWVGYIPVVKTEALIAALVWWQW